MLLQNQFSPSPYPEAVHFSKRNQPWPLIESQCFLSCSWSGAELCPHLECTRGDNSQGSPAYSFSWQNHRRNSYQVQKLPWLWTEIIIFGLSSWGRNATSFCLLFFWWIYCACLLINKILLCFDPALLLQHSANSFIAFTKTRKYIFFYNMETENQNYLIYLQGLLKENNIPYLEEEEFKKLPDFSSTYNVAEIKSQEQKSKTLLQTNIKQPLTARLVERYSRQMLLKQISYEGQLKLVNAKVAIIGSGGIGCPLGLYLGAAGIGTIGLFDSDSVQVTNLHRQVGHTTDRVGIQKTQSLKKSIASINPHITINQHPFITVTNASLLDSYDIVIDGSDNPKCRYIVNDYCMKTGKKLLSGACIGWEAQITCYGGQSLCYRCLWGNDQKSLGGCSTLGVIGMIPGLVGVILGLEALKMIVEGKSSLGGKLLTFDGTTCDFKKICLRKKKPECIGCGQNKLDMQTYDYTKYATCPVSSPSSQVKEVIWQTFLSQKLESQNILDVRPSNIYSIVHFLESENIPFEMLKKMSRQQILDFLKITDLNSLIPVSCARGITSKLAVQYLNSIGIRAISIAGGIKSYQKDIDQSVPYF